MINVEQLKQDLETLIAGLDNESTAEDFLTLVASVDSLTEDRIVSVATVNDLPQLYDGQSLSPVFPSGSIFFVEEIGVLVVSVGLKWLGLDGRVLSDETPPLFEAFGWGTAGIATGDGATANTSSPVAVVGITSWNQVSAGNDFSLGVASSGIAYAWGENSNGRLGDGTTTDRSSPVTVIGGISNWSQVSAGRDHNLGITDDGIAYAWGRNTFGHLGDGTTTNRSSPVTVIGGITGWSQVSSGGYHSLGLTDSGIAYAWGDNFRGQLGDGTRTNRLSPVTVVGNISNWSQVSSGQRHNLGVTDSGIAYAWGENFSGRLGDGTTTNRSSPVTVIGGISNWSQVSAGNEHSLGVTDDGIAYAWGLNEAGHLGDGTTADRSSPVTVIGGITNWSQVSGGEQHSLGLTDSGIAYAWGNGIEGALGNNSSGFGEEQLSPVTVVGGITSWTELSAGHRHGLGLALKIDQ